MNFTDTQIRLWRELYATIADEQGIVTTVMETRMLVAIMDDLIAARGIQPIRYPHKRKEDENDH